MAMYDFYEPGLGWHTWNSEGGAVHNRNGDRIGRAGALSAAHTVVQAHWERALHMEDNRTQVPAVPQSFAPSDAALWYLQQVALGNAPPEGTAPIEWLVSVVLTMETLTS